VEAKPYFEELTESIFENYNIDGQNIAYTNSVDDIKLDIDTIMPLGLIANELLSNTLKHAFKGRGNGKIDFKLQKQGKGLIMTIRDDGPGLPFEELPSRSKSLGLKLIRSFAEKLEAKIDIDNTNGAKISIHIPIIGEELMS